MLGLPREVKTHDRSDQQPRRQSSDGHGLLAGKVVVVTAAAGTGIGSPPPAGRSRKAPRRGLSDRHERRLAETGDQLGELGRGRVHPVVCDVTHEARWTR